MTTGQDQAARSASPSHAQLRLVWQELREGDRRERPAVMTVSPETCVLLMTPLFS